MLAIEHGRSESWIICKLEKQEQKNFVIGIKRKDWPCFTSLLGINCFLHFFNITTSDNYGVHPIIDGFNLG